MLRLLIPEAGGPQFIEITPFRNYDKLIMLCSYLAHTSLSICLENLLRFKHILFFSACESPRFGRNCKNYCYCFNNQACDHVSGSCPGGGCQKGWEGTSCSAGLYWISLFCQFIICFLNKRSRTILHWSTYFQLLTNKLFHWPIDFDWLHNYI